MTENRPANLHKLLEARQVGSQHDRILAMLREGPVCGSQFLAAYMPTYSQRIGELTKRGYGIERVECKRDYHRHQSNIATYLLVSDLDAVDEHFAQLQLEEDADA